MNENFVSAEDAWGKQTFQEELSLNKSHSTGGQAAPIMATAGPQRVLSVVYGDRLQTLHDLLVDLVARALQSRIGSEEGGRGKAAEDNDGSEASKRRAAATLSRDGDLAVYASLLRNSYAAISAAVPALGPVDSFEPRWTQQQLVERVLALKFREHARPANVLCFGYRKPRPPSLVGGDAAYGTTRRAPQGLECACENSAVNIVASPSWRLLHSRVGDVIMLHVLSHAAVFTPLPNGSFLQILGAPVSDLVRTPWKGAASVDIGEKRRPEETHFAGSCNAGRGRRIMEADGSLGVCSNRVQDRGGTCSHDCPQECVVRNARNSRPLKRCRTEDVEAEVHGRTKRCEYAGRACRKRRKLRPGNPLFPAGTTWKMRGGNDLLDGLGSVRVTHALADVPAEKSSANLDENQNSGRAWSGNNHVHGKSGELAAANGRHSNGLGLRVRPTQVAERVGRCQVASGLHAKAGQVRQTFSSVPLQKEPSHISKARAFCSPEQKRLTRQRGNLSAENLHQNCKDTRLIPDSVQHRREASDAKEKRVRPPSWRRRKIWKMQESATEPVEERVTNQGNNTCRLQQDSSMEWDEENDRLTTKVSHKLACGLTSNIADLGCGLRLGEAKRSRVCGQNESQQGPPRKKTIRELETSFAPEQKIVDRSPIFYNSNFSRRSGLPAKHILNVTKANDNGAAHLLLAIFQCNKSMLKPGCEIRCHSIHKLLKELLSKAKRCAFARLLGRHCPLPQGFRAQQTLQIQQQERELNEDTVDDKQQDRPPVKLEAEGEDLNKVTQQASGYVKTAGPELISCYTDHNKVVGFLWSVCRSTIPQDMLGSVKSWRALRSSIAHFVGLRRHEKFSLQRALFRLRLSDFGWLDFDCGSEKSSTRPIHSRQYSGEERKSHQENLELWLYWVFSSLVVPTIRAHFYVTENETQRQTVFYYRKPVWARICSHRFKELIGKTYKKLTRHAVSQALHCRVFGFSQIRFVPKRSSVRPVANLAASSHGTLKFALQSQEQANLHKIFGDILDGHGLRDSRNSDCVALPSSRKVYSLLDEEWTGIRQPYNASRPLRTRKDTLVPAKRSFLEGSISNSLGPEKASSCPALSFVSVRAPQIQETSKKTVNYFFRSINSVLRDAHCCLKFEKDTHPDDSGSSVFGYSDIHAKVLPFILQLKGSLNGMPQLFMAVCDMTNAYDTIQQEKLYQIVESFVQHSCFKVARYTRITPALASTRVSYGRVCTLADRPHGFADSVHALARRCSHGVFVEQALCTTVTRGQILTMLQEHVTQNIVHIGAHFYRQTVGIPQGSILSSLLCSLFYDHFDVHSLLPLLQSPLVRTSSDAPGPTPSLYERTDTCREKASFFPLHAVNTIDLTDCDLEEMLERCLHVPETSHVKGLMTKPPVRNMVSHETVPSASCRESCHKHTGNTMLFNQMQSHKAVGRDKTDFLLLRLIDDSLFISTSQDKARKFVNSMHRGSKEYGCQANKQKTSANFYLQIGKDGIRRSVYSTEDGARFMRWSGLLINCHTMEFQADYTRYCGDHIRSTLTVRREQHPGHQLVLKMCEYMRPKCHALFFDPRINSPATIGLNAFQAFLLCAMKFHAYICCMRHLTGSNQPFLYVTINCTISYMFGLLSRKLDDVGAEPGAYLPFNELQWLALIAFHRVLRRKQARYPILLHILRTQLQLPKYNKLRFCPHLLSAVDERRSSMFKWIKY